MPQRSNEFQELVALIQRALAPRGAKVTCSAMVEVPGLEDTEIDVLIEGDFGPFKMKVAVEAKDENRRFDIGAFRQYLGKYRGECRVPVDKFVIVTRKGFTSQVQAAARKADVELLTLAEAQERDWTSVAPHMMQFTFPPHVCEIAVDPPVPDVTRAEIRKNGRLICQHCGKDCGSLFKYVNRLVFQGYLPHHPECVKELENRVRSSKSGNGYWDVGFAVPGCRLAIGEKQFPLVNVYIRVHAVSAKGALICKRYKMDSSRGHGHEFKHFQGELGGKKFSILMPNVDKPRAITMKIERADDAAAEDRRTLASARRKERKRRSAKRKKKKDD